MTKKQELFMSELRSDGTPHPALLDVKAHQYGIKKRPARGKFKAQILASIWQPKTIQEISEITQINQNSIRRLLHELYVAQKIEKNGRHWHKTYRRIDDVSNM